jgi:hypothetical protein
MQRKMQPFTPAMRWVGERQIMALCIAVAVIVPLVSLKLANSAIEAAKSSIWTVQIDAAGAYTVAPASMASPDDEVYKEMAMQAAELSLKRNPKGLSYPEFVTRMFSGAALDDVQSHVKATLADRTQRNLYDSPEITAVEQLDKASTATTYRVTGIIIRSASVDGYATRDRGQFKMLIQLDPQPMLTLRGRYPFVPKRWAVKIKWDSGGSEEWGNGLREIKR